jgi:hypothetical protein
MFTQVPGHGYPGLGGGEGELWRVQLGARPCNGGVAFRVWAPKRKRVEVVLETEDHGVDLSSEEGGYFAGLLAFGFFDRKPGLPSAATAAQN